MSMQSRILSLGLALGAVLTLTSGALAHTTHDSGNDDVRGRCVTDAFAGGEPIITARASQSASAHILGKYKQGVSFGVVGLDYGVDAHFSLGGQNIYSDSEYNDGNGTSITHSGWDCRSFELSSFHVTLGPSFVFFDVGMTAYASHSMTASTTGAVISNVAKVEGNMYSGITGYVRNMLALSYSRYGFSGDPTVIQSSCLQLHCGTFDFDLTAQGYSGSGHARNTLHPRRIRLRFEKPGVAYLTLIDVVLPSVVVFDLSYVQFVPMPRLPRIPRFR